MSLLDEPRISLSALARREVVHVATVSRWCLRGIRGHRLESLNIGGKRFTTLPAYDRWIAAINDGAVVPRNNQERQECLQQAKRALREAGLIDEPAANLKERRAKGQ